MLSLTLHHMKTGWKRLVAAGIAIALGTGFVAAALLAGGVLGAASAQSFTADYRGSDIVVNAEEYSTTALDVINNYDGVTDTRFLTRVGVELTAGARTEWGGVAATPPRADMLPGDITSGTLPVAIDDIALREGGAARLGVGIGDTVELTSSTWIDDGTPDGVWTEKTERFTVSALFADATDIFSYGSDYLITPAALTALAPDRVNSGELALSLTTGADIDHAAHDLSDQLGDGYSVQTVAQLADQALARFGGGASPITALLLAFAGVALAVAILVIGNTFAVLVAQRTRLLALLRTIGASRGQVRRSVLLEATLLGLAASVAGLALGYGIVALAITVVSSRVPGIDLWQGFSITPGLAVAVVIAGVLATLMAGWVPARAATRVKPLAALRPEPVTLGTTAGKVRLTVAILALGGGLLLLGGAVGIAGLFGSRSGGDATTLALLVGMLGGFMMVFGIIFGAVFVISGLIRAAGAIFGRGATARIATLNAIRNPRRTAATTNALFIGVALVILMATGAASAKASLQSSLTEYFPIDVRVSSVDDTALTSAQIDAISRAEGIAAVTPVAHTSGYVMGIDEQQWGADIYAPADDAAFSDAEAIAGLTTQSVLVDSGKLDRTGADIGDTITIGAHRDGLVEADDAVVQARIAGLIGDDIVVMTPEMLQHISPDTPYNEMWLRIDPDAAAGNVVADLQETLTQLMTVDPSAPLLSVEGSVIVRNSLDTVIDTMLLIVLALLAVAVVIALVGVANTLSLSVIERRRESATLRALGMTKKQLRRMLAAEGILIAVVGAVIGIIAGLGFGWAGAWILLSGVGTVVLAVPWAEIGVVFAVALLAGLIASVLPSRAATKVSPVVALAEE